MEIFVGNLAPQTTEAELTDLFKTYGEVRGAQIKRDLFSGVSKGFAFVEMPGRQHSLNAIAGLNGKDLNGKPMKVNEALGHQGRGGRRR
jgi:RNA recognition motif-containing protein